MILPVALEQIDSFTSEAVSATVEFGASGTDVGSISSNQPKRCEIWGSA